MVDSTSEFDDKVVVKMENRVRNVQGQASSSTEKITLLTLHEDVFQEILSHFSYDEIAKLRLVCYNFSVH